MWEDLTIGTGDYQCSATKVFAIKGDHSISQNSTCYWISGAYLEISLRIFKDTEEGKQLSEFVARGAHIDEITPWLDGVILRNIEPEKLKLAVDRALKQAYENGSNDRAAEIRRALGII